MQEYDRINMLMVTGIDEFFLCRGLVGIVLIRSQDGNKCEHAVEDNIAKHEKCSTIMPFQLLLKFWKQFNLRLTIFSKD